MECRRWTCTMASPVIELPDTVNSKDVCLCDYSATPCTYYELATTNLSNPEDGYTNDYRKFLIDPLSANSPFSIVLIEKDGTEHVVYSDSETSVLFGDVYEQGFNTDQPLQVGACIKWYKVAESLGYGDYTVRISQTDFGTEVVKESHVFRVIKYNAQRLNGTIKIEVDNVGVTMNGANWTGLTTDSNNGFVNMIRVKGRIVLTDPEIVRESIEDGNRIEQPVQTKETDFYEIKVENVPFGIGYSLIHEEVLMKWSVTDYNLFNEDLRNKVVIIESTTVNNTPDYMRKYYDITAKSEFSKLNRKFV